LAKGFLKRFFKENKDDDIPLFQVIKNQDGKLDDYEKTMIMNILELKNISAKEVMVPRVDVIGININMEMPEIIKIVDQNGRSRLPVYNDNIDNICGILHTKDLFKYFVKKQGFDISKILREPFFIPESKNIYELLVELKEKKNHIAIVVDEYGGMSGIVSFEDIIEMIVGDINDEFDKVTEEVVKISDGRYIVEGRIALDELNEKIGSDFFEEDIDTLGGLIFMIFGKIPVKNEKIEYKNYLFTIESISGRKIKKVRIETINAGDVKDYEK
jgi:magnesium and cobalt transporter